MDTEELVAGEGDELEDDKTSEGTIVPTDVKAWFLSSTSYQRCGLRCGIRVKTLSLLPATVLCSAVRLGSLVTLRMSLLRVSHAQMHLTAAAAVLHGR